MLDVGCGDGQLMELLQSERGARTRGLEVEQAGVNRCVAKGLAVVQGNADADLPVYPDDAYDVAILSKTIQELARPEIRARRAVAHRPQGDRVVPQLRPLESAHALLTSTGRIPSLASNSGWWSDGARRPCTARDMAELADELGLHITAATAVSGVPVGANALTRLNWTAEELVFVLERSKTRAE